MIIPALKLTLLTVVFIGKDKTKLDKVKSCTHQLYSCALTVKTQHIIAFVILLFFLFLLHVSAHSFGSSSGRTHALESTTKTKQQ
jgi:hypothetical protein